MPLTTVQAGMLDTTAQYYSFKNRIINGAMVIDQRNNGASVNTSGAYPVDRFLVSNGVTSWTAQRSTVAPAGFTNSFLYTSVTGSAAGTNDRLIIRQRIEGFNWADLGWGTASAQTVTLSFKVRSSLTGTFSGSFRNGDEDRSYPFSFTISAANTFEDKSITVPGETTGVWGTGNSLAVQLSFDMGSGSGKRTTAGAWVAGDFVGVTGAVSVSATTGATFYITGVQLEKGSTATSFDYRPYGTELMLCQRYFEMSYDIGTAPATATTTGIRYTANGISGAVQGAGGVVFQVPKRTAPTVATYDGAGAANNVSTVPSGGTTFTNGRAYSGAPFNISTNGFTHPGQATVGNVSNFIHFTASAEL
jgi:hypothetical protein